MISAFKGIKLIDYADSLALSLMISMYRHDTKSNVKMSNYGQGNRNRKRFHKRHHQFSVVFLHMRESKIPIFKTKMLKIGPLFWQVRLKLICKWIFFSFHSLCLATRACNMYNMEIKHRYLWASHLWFPHLVAFSVQWHNWVFPKCFHWICWIQW